MMFSHVSGARLGQLTYFQLFVPCSLTAWLASSIA